jgi:hypothetical protein
MRDHKKIYIELIDALAIWKSRKYMQKTKWTKTNENRKRKSIEIISSLIDYYREHGTLSDKQIELAKIKIENANENIGMTKKAVKISKQLKSSDKFRTERVDDSVSCQINNQKKIDKKFITINCDESFKDGSVTWGVWITSDHGRSRHSGNAKKGYNDSTEAELISIYEGLAIVFKSDIWTDCDIIIVNNDNIGAIGLLEDINRHHKKYGYIIDGFYKLFSYMNTKRKLEIFFKHVKGHSRNSDTRKYVNNI